MDLAQVTIYGLVSSDEPRRVRYVGATVDRVDRLAAHRRCYCHSPEMRAWAEGMGPRLLMIVLDVVGDEVSPHAENRWIDRMKRRGMADFNRACWNDSSRRNLRMNAELDRARRVWWPEPWIAKLPAREQRRIAREQEKDLALFACRRRRTG